LIGFASANILFLDGQWYGCIIAFGKNAREIANGTLVLSVGNPLLFF
jgi:prepilin-type processing-associated H-X9-DG protein